MAEPEHACRSCRRPLAQSRTASGRLARWPVWCDACRPARQRWERGWCRIRSCYRCGTPFLTNYQRGKYCGSACRRRGTLARLESARAYDRRRAALYRSSMPDEEFTHA